MGMDPVRPARGRVAEPAVLGETHHDAIVHQEAVLVAHEAVAAAPDRQARHDVGVEHVEEAARIGPLHEDLAQRRGVEETELRARVGDLAGHRVAMALARTAVAVGPAPETHGLPIGAMGLVPVVHGRAAQRLEDLAPRLAHQRAEGDGRIGRAEGGGADRGDRRIERACEHGQPVDVAELALIGGHAERRVALGVLDRLVALAGGELHIRHFHVVLVVEPHLRAQRGRGALRHDPDRLGRRLLGALRPRRLALAAHGADRVGQHVGREQLAIGRARNRHHGRAVMGDRRAGRIGPEGRLRLVPDQLAAAVAPEMDDRRPAARHGDRIAVEGRAPPPRPPAHRR